MLEDFNTVLLIDDDELSHFITQRVINSSGFAKEIFTFMSAKGAFGFLEKALENKSLLQFPAVIFLDISMPELDGWDFLNAYRILPAELKEKCQLYILSSSKNEMDVFRSKTYPDVCRFISKPLSKQILKEIKIGKEEVI